MIWKVKINKDNILDELDEWKKKLLRSNNNTFLSKKNIGDENPTPEIDNLPTFSDAFLAVSAGPTAFFVLKSNFIFLILVRTL